MDNLRNRQTIEKIQDTLINTRKTLFYILLILIAGLFIRAHMNELRFDLKYLERNYAILLKRLENTSLLDAKLPNEEKLFLEFQEWSDQQMKMIQRDIHLLKDNVKSVKFQNGIDNEELTRYDLALGSAGGRVVSVHETRLMDDCSPAKILLGACHRRNPPEKVIEASNNPGQCFCFKGTEGSFTIRLSCEALLEGATLEHIPRKLSPTSDLSSAPKKFKLTGYKKIDDAVGIEYGTFEFNPTDMHKRFYSMQKLSAEKVKYVKMTILENHGDETQTCIYRIQIHGFVEKC